MERYLTTNERVQRAVDAGHGEKVIEHIRMHNNGDGLELETLSLTDDKGHHHTWTKLPSYGVAAVDCYLNLFDIPTRVTEQEGWKFPTFDELAAYAAQAAKDAAVYRTQKHRPQELIDRVFSGLVFEAIDTNYGLLVAIYNAKSPEHSGLQLLRDEEHDSETLILSSGARVELTKDTDLEPGFEKAYVLLTDGGAREIVTQQWTWMDEAVRIIDVLAKEVAKHQ